MRRKLVVACVRALFTGLGCSTCQMSELETASQKVDFPAVKKMIDKGANIEWLDRGNTPLEAALEKDNYDTAKYPVSRGANIGHAKRILKAAGPIASMTYVVKLDMLRHEPSGMPKYSAPIARPSYDPAQQLLPAVNDFEAKSMARSAAQTASDWLRAEIINTGAFSVIERSAMEAILKEQAYSMTECADTSCAIDWRIIDVEKGVAEFAHKETVSSMGYLDKGVARFAKNLALRSQGLAVKQGITCRP